MWSHFHCCRPASFLLACSKSCFHFSYCEAAKSGDNGADRGSVGETEELDHICAVLVTTLTLEPTEIQNGPTWQASTVLLARPPFVFPNI